MSSDRASAAAPAASASKGTDTVDGGLWIGQATDAVLSTFKDKAVYKCAAGHSPSGTIHFGNFRDIITSIVGRLRPFPQGAGRGRSVFR
jgi:hypothetical protein